MGRRLAASVFTVVAAATALFGCGSDSKGTVVVYTGRHYDVEKAFDQFAKDTGISVQFLPGNDAELRERIEAEGEETTADVYLTVDAANLAIGTEQGIFRAIKSPVLDAAVPESLRDPDGRWYGLSLRARTIVFNPEAIDREDVPTTYEELADPKWKGRLCLRNSSNVYTQSLVASLIAHDGYDEALDVVKGWADNADIMANDVLILESIAEGACDVGIANHYYLARLLQDDPDFPVELLWADQDGLGVHVNISGGGVTKYADDPDLAQQLLEWLATDGQKVFVDGNHEYPVNPDIEPDDLISENFGADFRQDDLNAQTFGELNAEAVKLMDEAGYK
jgi:iron(III) transport system substrate-binding protein